MIAIDLLEKARQESEQKRLAAQIVAECAGQMDEFLTLIDGALTAAGDGSLDTEPQTVSEATDSVFGTLDLGTQEEISSRWGVSESYKNSQPYHNNLYPY